MKWLHKFSDPAYSLLRIISGFMFSFHGMQKIFGLFAASQPPFGTQLWFGGIIELLGGLAILIGFKTRIAAFLCSGMMAVAYFQFHWKYSEKFHFGPDFFPTINGGELAVLYAFIFLYIACRGGVMWCIDRKGS